MKHVDDTALDRILELVRLGWFRDTFGEAEDIEAAVLELKKYRSAPVVFKTPSRMVPPVFFPQPCQQPSRTNDPMPRTTEIWCRGDS